MCNWRFACSIINRGFSLNLKDKNGEDAERRALQDSDKFFDGRYEENAVYVKPGDVIFSDDIDEMLVAKLGSGVFVSVFDVDLKISAVAYIMLPRQILEAFPHLDDVDAKMLEKAMAPIEECLVQMKTHGAGKNRIRVSLLGGARLEGEQGQDAGNKNYVFVREALKKKGLKIFQEDLGGEDVLRVHFFPRTGKIIKNHLKRKSDADILGQVEQQFHENSTFSV